MLAIIILFAHKYLFSCQFSCVYFPAHRYDRLWSLRCEWTWYLSYWAAASNSIALFGLPFLAPGTTDRKKKDLSQIKALLSISDTKWKKNLGGYLNLIYNLEPNLAQYNPQSNPKPSCNMNNRKKIIIIETYKGVGVMFLQQKLTVKIIFLWYFCTIFFFTENDYLFLNIIAKYIFFTFLILKNSQVAFVYINIKIISWNILFHFFRLLLYNSIKICRFLYIWCALLIDGILNV